jgi:hypothetical protein
LAHQISEKLNPNNCDSSSGNHIPVTAATIDAVNDTVSPMELMEILPLECTYS